MRNAFFAVLGLALVLVGCSAKDPSAAQVPVAPPAGPAAAMALPAAHSADLKPTQGHETVGTLDLDTEGDVVTIKGAISGLTPNSTHGFHVHEKGDCSAPDASSAGEHFDPTAQQHGNPDSPPHHGGDAHNLTADAQGVASVDARLSGVTLGDGAATDIVGKAVVVHAKPDDYKTQPSGNSGDRIACGVIR